MKKRVFSTILLIIVVVTLLPQHAFAAKLGDSPGSGYIKVVRATTELSVSLKSDLSAYSSFIPIISGGANLKNAWYGGGDSKTTDSLHFGYDTDADKFVVVYADNAGVDLTAKSGTIDRLFIVNAGWQIALPTQMNGYVQIEGEADYHVKWTYSDEEPQKLVYDALSNFLNPNLRGSSGINYTDNASAINFALAYLFSDINVTDPNKFLLSGSKNKFSIYKDSINSATGKGEVLDGVPYIWDTSVASIACRGFLYDAENNSIEYDLSGLAMIDPATIPEDAKDPASEIARLFSGMKDLKDKEFAEEEAKKSDALIKEAMANWDALTEYQRWESSMSYYDLNKAKELSTVFDKAVGYEIGITTVAELPQPVAGKLSVEEITRLKAYLKILHDARLFDVAGNEIAVSDKGYTLDKEVAGWKYVAPTYTATPVYIPFSTSGPKLIETPDVLRMAREYASQKFSGDVDTTIDAFAYNFSKMAPWLVARLYGISLGDVNDAAQIPNNVYISAMATALSSTNQRISIASGLPEMKNVRQMGDTEDSYQSYVALCYNILAVAHWATIESASGISTEEGKEPTNIELEKFLSDNESAPNKNEIPIPNNIARQIQYYMSIKEGLEFLGITSWTKELTYIVSKFTEISAYKDNTGIADYNATDSKEPLVDLFSVTDRRLSDDYLKGILMSASYIPMQTNLYDPNSLQLLDDIEWVSRFHYVYGFYRKALYIDTNINAAVDQYVSGKRGATKVATLKDLLETDKDIVLYVDDNFYNIQQLAETQGYAYSKMANTDESGKENLDIGEVFGDLFDTNVETVVKTGANQKYSETVAGAATKYNEDKNGLFNKWIDDLTLLSKDRIKTYLGQNEYSPMQSFAVVSSIYRHPRLFDIEQEMAVSQPPVFVSSPNLAGVVGVGQEQFNTIYNYSILKNLEAGMGIDYRTSLDLDSNIYIDIYGNIITESGLVVVPAASNATLHKASSYSILTAGFLAGYGKDYSIPDEYPNSEKLMLNAFEVDEEDGQWNLKSVLQGDKFVISLKDVPVSDKASLQTFVTLYKDTQKTNPYDFKKTVWLITEVLRGAPLENIDKTFEGLQGNRGINKFGVYLAYRLEELTNQFISGSNGNSMITLPNLAYMEGVEYIVMFGFKILFAATICILLYKLYIDSVQRRLGLKTFGSFLGTLLIFVVGVMTVPNLLNFSYYETNRYLLQDEAKYIALLNMEKNEDGREIGVYEITSPTSTTKLYIKLDELSVPWYEAFSDVLMANSMTTMSDIYEEALNNNPMSNLPGVEKKANGLYMNVNYLFDTSSVEFNVERKFLRHAIHEEPYASYVIPYYVILDNLVAQTNMYNSREKILSYTTKIQDRGAVKTVGMVTPYLTSNEFMETGVDIIGLNSVYGDTSGLAIESQFSEEEMDRMRASLWFSEKEMEPEELNNKLSELTESARQFVAKNKTLLGKVTDETFLKMMALSMSLEHNRIFNIPSCKALEIMDMDSKDIIRMSLASKETVMKQSTSSFSRFVYDNGGTISVILVAVLIIIYFLSSILKPALILIVIGSMIASIFVRKLVLHKNDRSVEGYITTMGLLCGTNLVYALLMKASLSLPSLGLTPAVSIIWQILLQLVYFIIMSLVVAVILKDWQSMGFNRYSRAFGNINTFMTHRVNMMGGRISMNNQQYDYYKDNMLRQDLTGKRKTRGLTGSSILERMHARDQERRNRKR